MLKRNVLSNLDSNLIPNLILVIGLGSVIVGYQFSATGAPGEKPSVTVTDFFKKFTAPAKTPKSDHEFVSLHFSGSQNCGFCHNGITDDKGQDVSIETAWSSTMMANSSRDPLWRAKIESEIKRNPKHKKLLEDKCTRCHAPMANVEARKIHKPYDVFGDTGILNPDHLYFDAAMDGVSCTACHQIKPTKEMGTLAGFSGKYQIDSQPFDNRVERKIYGPYKDPFTGPMRNHVEYTPTHSNHISQAKLCASCHNLKTPYVDKAGNVIPKTPEQEFPEQQVYSEWKASAYSKGARVVSCQACHMKASSNVIISQRPPWLDTVRPKFRQHIFVGGNKFMLQMMKDNRELLGISANNFEFSIQKTEQMLKSAANLKIKDIKLAENNLNFSVNITNTAGHKLPSGYPSRRVFLQVTIRDANDKVVFQSGKEEGFGRIKGVDADDNANKYEPHYDVIRSEDQVQVYEAIMQNYEKKVTYTLLQGASYAKDNRLLPRGFDKTKVSSDVAVAGAAFKDKDFKAGGDMVKFAIAVGKSSGPFKIQASLRYQTASYRYVRDLLKEPGRYGKQFGYLYNKAKQFSTEIAGTEAKTETKATEQF